MAITYPGSTVYPRGMLFPGTSSAPPLARQSLRSVGTNVTFTTASADGDLAAPGTGVLLVVRNTGGTACQLRINVVAKHHDLAIADRVVPLPANKLTAVPLIPLYADPEQFGFATWTYDTYDAGLSLAVIV